MRPSETTAGRDWLQNFTEPDRPTATELLDSLRFVELSTLHTALTALLESLISNGSIPAPALVLPERSLKEFDIHGSDRELAVAYNDFQPGAHLSATPGSDAFVAGIISQFTNASRSAEDSPWIPPQADIAEQRLRRCRSIVVITDYVGTGQQTLTLTRAITRNRTIRSWRSLHLVQVHVVAFAINSTAAQRVRADKSVDQLWHIEAAPDFESAGWSTEMHDAIVALCELEARNNRATALGFDGSAGLFVTQRRAPNNLPAVFLQSKGSWHPLFPNRNVPPGFAAQLGEYRPAVQLPEIALRLGQLRLGQNERLGYLRAGSERLLRALVLIHQQARTTETLAAEMALDIWDAEAVLESLRQLNLIEESGRVTARGQLEISAQKRRRRRTTAGLTGSDAPYYPWSLR
jgi:hypothetical protein